MPVFLWLVIVPQTATADLIAAGILGLAGLTDWLDGKLARMLNQQSRLGQLLDPAADRLYIAATVIALAIRGIIPWWLFGALAARELCVGIALLVLKQRTPYSALQVSFVGKTATLCLCMRFRFCSSARIAARSRRSSAYSAGPSPSGGLSCIGGRRCCI